MACRVLVHEMRHHVVRVPVDPLFTRMVEMELDELVLLLVQGDEAAGCVVDLNRVAVVDELERNGMIVEAELRQVGAFGIANVDGRLMSTGLAGRVLRLEIAPVLRSGASLVTPVRG